MLAHRYRLRSKEVRFLTKKRQYYSQGYFGFFYVQQYANRAYHQVSFHVSIKYSKHATKRNRLKRQVMRRIRDWENFKLPFAGTYRKVFVVLNKQQLDSLMTQDPHTFIAQFQASFTSFLTFL